MRMGMGNFVRYTCSQKTGAQFYLLTVPIKKFPNEITMGYTTFLTQLFPWEISRLN